MGNEDTVDAHLDLPSCCSSAMKLMASKGADSHMSFLVLEGWREKCCKIFYFFILKCYGLCHTLSEAQWWPVLQVTQQVSSRHSRVLTCVFLNSPTPLWMCLLLCCKCVRTKRKSYVLYLFSFITSSIKVCVHFLWHNNSFLFCTWCVWMCLVLTALQK